MIFHTIELANLWQIVINSLCLPTLEKEHQASINRAFGCHPLRPFPEAHGDHNLLDNRKVFYESDDGHFPMAHWSKEFEICPVGGAIIFPATME